MILGVCLKTGDVHRRYFIRFLNLFQYIVSIAIKFLGIQVSVKHQPLFSSKELALDHDDHDVMIGLEPQPPEVAKLQPYHEVVMTSAV